MIHNRGPICGLTNPCWVPTQGPTGSNDAADPDRPLFLRDRAGVRGLGLGEGGILLAKKGGIALPAGAKVADLYLYDASSSRRDEVIMAREMFKISGAKAMKAVKSWDALAAAIRGHSSIGRLVLSFHGYGGGLIVGNHARDLDQASVRSLFTKGGAATQIGEIAFMGCNIGSRPAKLAAFGKMFGAKKVSGYTWFLVHQRVTVRPGGSDDAAIRKALEPYRKFILPPLGKARLTPNATSNFLVIYGASAYETAKFPLSFGDARKFKPLSEAGERTITGKDAVAVEKELEASPVSPFQRIVVSGL